ncbi:MAG: hypothetical protein KJ052_10150, partial [Candidatus Hydrogenedentes bacterium]|nr:hypothetical protein [Candidatus Hydrogenedentota bacterium]
NHTVNDNGGTTVKKWIDGKWEIGDSATYRVNGNGLELAISRESVGETGRAPAFDFHWADNIQGFSGVEELGVNGDSAPNRRWSYRFSVAE